MTLRAVLFDLDDTLHEKSGTLRAVAAAQYGSAKLASIAVKEGEWELEYVRLNNLRIEKTEVFARLQAHFELPSPLTATLLKDFDSNLGRSARPCAGALELVEACRVRGLKVGIVTNGRDAFQRSKIEGIGLTELVDLVVTSGEFGAKKPDQRIFRHCLEGLEVLPAEAAFVGDDFEADMAPSIELGMRAIWKSPTGSPRVAFSSESLYEIRAFLLQAV